MTRFPSDASGVKEAIVGVPEDRCPLDKERSALFKVLLIGRKIEAGWICLYLPKIGVDCGVERYARGDAVLYITADVPP